MSTVNGMAEVGEAIKVRESCFVYCIQYDSDLYWGVCELQIS